MPTKDEIEAELRLAQAIVDSDIDFDTILAHSILARMGKLPTDLKAELRRTRRRLAITQS